MILYEVVMRYLLLRQRALRIRNIEGFPSKRGSFFKNGQTETLATVVAWGYKKHPSLTLRWPKMTYNVAVTQPSCGRYLLVFIALLKTNFK